LYGGVPRCRFFSYSPDSPSLAPLVWSKLVNANSKVEGTSSNVSGVVMLPVPSGCNALSTVLVTTSSASTIRVGDDKGGGTGTWPTQLLGGDAVHAQLLRVYASNTTLYQQLWGVHLPTGAVHVFDRNSHSRMPLVSTPARFKLLQACDQWHSSRVFTFLTGSRVG
jgi:hypothetical protein